MNTSRCFLFLFALVFARTVPAVAAVPDDFAQEVRVTGLARPVAMAFLPDGRLLVAEQQTAQVKLLLPEATQIAGTVLTVPGVQFNRHGEAGLLSLAVDPGWPQRPYLYCHYTASTPQEMRLTRFTASGDLEDAQSASLTFASGTAVDVLDGIPDVFGNHNGGTLRFGTDGHLYFSLGDDESRCSAQVVDDFRGKVLRLDVSRVPDRGDVARSDLVAAGNPFVGQGEIAGLVWAIGMRNPFRMALDARSGGLFVGDVGQFTREEISHVQGAGRNLGWPYREGTTDFPEQGGCPDPPGIELLEPIYDYGREEGASVVAGFVYRRPAGATRPWPLEYEGEFFFIDFFKDYLVRLTGAGQTWSIAPAVTGQPAPGRWATGMSQAADFALAPDGSVYYVTLTGTVQRIRYTGTIVPTDRASVGGLRSRYR